MPNQGKKHSSPEHDQPAVNQSHTFARTTNEMVCRPGRIAAAARKPIKMRTAVRNLSRAFDEIPETNQTLSNIAHAAQNQGTANATVTTSKDRETRYNLQQTALAKYFTEQHKRDNSAHKTRKPENKGIGQESDKSENQPADLSAVIQNIVMDIADRPLPTLEEIANPSDHRTNIEGTAIPHVPRTPHKIRQSPRKPMTPARLAANRKYMRDRRKEIWYRDKERAARQRRARKPCVPKTKPCPMKKLILKFKAAIAIGPTFVCMSCNRMLYRHSVQGIQPTIALDSPISRLCTTKMDGQRETTWICFTCRRHIHNGRVPPMSLANGLAFPKKPVKMDLHQLEWRLLAPRIVFMKIHQAPQGKQYKVVGNVVNVVASVANTVNSLPRTMDNAATIPVKLKRRLRYKHHAISQNIRPNSVRHAARWLVKNGPLYQKAGIRYNDKTWRFSLEQQNSEVNKSPTPLYEPDVWKGPDATKKQRYVCTIDKCKLVTMSYADADAHVRKIHKAHDIGYDIGHTSTSSEVLIEAQDDSQHPLVYQYYCPVCDEDFKSSLEPTKHMYLEHALLDLDSALTYHNCAGGVFTLTTYKAYDLSQVAIIHDLKKTEALNMTYVIELMTLKMSQLHIEKRTKKGEPSRKWSIHHLPEDQNFKRIMNNITNPANKPEQEANCKELECDGDIDYDSDTDLAGSRDSMVTEQDYLEPPEFQAIYSFAPAENKTPKSIFLDRYCEEMAYPDIYLGHARPNIRHVPVNYSDIVKSELLQVDRRAALNVENLFFKTKKLQMKLLTSRTNLALRQHKTHDMAITAGTLRDTTAVKNIILHDQGYQFLSTLRGSPPYFQRAKKDLFAMIRQLGPATFFISLSAAETKWTHLLKILGQTVDKVEYSDDDIKNMTWETRCRLIQSDPITCARHFDFQLHIVLAKFMKDPLAPLGNILDYFYRVEMQHRGSCHVHMVVWVEGAPALMASNMEEVIKFINKYITCQAAVAEGTTESDLVSRQKHSHTQTCKKNKNSVCRFHYPQPPFPKTVILDKIPEDDPRIEEYKKKWTTIHKELEEMARGTEITFEEFLTKMDLSYEEYEKCVQTTLQARTIFLRRTPQEITINNYNRNTMLAWEANMDIQYVLDAYACATYIVSYMSKGSRGMSKLLAQASAEARAGNTSVTDSMRHIGNQFLNSVEISAQEAAYLALQLALRKSSRITVFINTAPPHERVRLLKKKADLEAMDDEDTNIDSSNLIKRYGLRKKKQEQMCLAEWAAWFDIAPKKRPAPELEEDVDGTPVQDLAPLYEEDPEDYPIEPISEVAEKKRKKARVLRCPWFDAKIKEDHHYRELIMLFVPWRNEKDDLIGGYESHKQHYEAKKDLIMQRLEEYSPGRSAVEEAQERQALEQVERQENAVVAPATQHANEMDQAEPSSVNDPTLKPKYDIGPDMGVEVLPGVSMGMYQHNQISESQLYTSIRELNSEQRTFFDYINNTIRNGKEQIFAFLSGGAGVGKSHLTKAIYQQLLRLYNTTAGEDAESIRVLVMAPTGKSAHIIKGLTIHSALRMPFNRVKAEYIPLSISTLNTMRSNMGDLKFAIIDEVSMVGTNLFNYVDRRLQDIKGCRRPFGGCHMLCIGDLFQLQPVCDPWIFLLPKEGMRSLGLNPWSENFKLYELKTIMRQKDHQPFAQLLNRLREGNQTEEDLDYLESKCIREKFSNTNYPYKGITHLYSRNQDVEDFNHAVRRNIPIHIEADDHLNGTCNEELTRIHLQQMKEKPAKDCQGLASVLSIALDDRVEVSQNIAVRDGLTNGAAGTVKKLPEITDNTDSLTAAGVVWVLFDEQGVGEKMRSNRKRLYNPQINKAWTPIEPQMKRIQISRRTEITATRTQFPLRIAAAKTIHRSQGQTLNAVVTDFTAAFGHHMHYVALSRVTNPEKLYITYFDRNNIKTDVRVHDEMERLRASAMLKIPRMLDYRVMGSNTVACYINIRSLNKHADDLGADYNFKNSFITVVAETNLLPTTNLQKIMESHPHSDHNRRNLAKTTPAAKHGISCFATMPLESVIHNNTMTMECTTVKVQYPQACTIIGVYRYHRTTIADFFTDLRELIQRHKGDRLVIMGDMNLNTQIPAIEHKIRAELLDNSNLQQLPTGPTTKAGTTIDHVYTNIRGATAYVVPTYYSDHDMIKVSTI